MYPSNESTIFKPTSKSAVVIVTIALLGAMMLARFWLAPGDPIPNKFMKFNFDLEDLH